MPNSTRSIPSVLGLTAALWLALGGAAQAAPFSIVVTSEVTVDPSGGVVAPVGSLIEVEFVVDSATPNETAAAGWRR